MRGGPTIPQISSPSDLFNHFIPWYIWIIMLEDGVAPAFFISLSSASYYHQREKISRLNAMHFFVSFILLVFYCCFYESLCCTSKDQFMPSIFFLFFIMSWVVKNKREENNPFIFCSFLNSHVWRALKYICAI